MMRSHLFRRPILSLGLGLAALLAALPTPAQPGGPRPPSPWERREALRPVYLALRTDPQFLTFQRELAARPHDAALYESFLRFLPISPLDFLQIDMEVRHYEVAIPRPVYEQHARWVRLHEAKARELYGDAHVDSVRTGWPAEPRAPRVEARKTPLQSLTEYLLLGTNRNLAATDSPPPIEYQGEIQVAVNPNNPNQIVAAANTWDAPAGCESTQAIFSSGDGGATWNYTCAPGESAYPSLGPCFGDFIYGSDPAVYWDDNNRVYLNHMLICSAIRGGDSFAMVVARSTDGGATWAGQGVVVNGWATFTLEDKNFYIIDNNLTSPYHGRHYSCWDRSNNEKIAYSSDSGATWTEVDLPASPVGGIDLGCEMAVEDNGTVHVIFDSLTCSSTTGTCSTESMLYTKSTDGGVSWSAPVVVRNFNLVSFSGNNCPSAQNDRCINPFGAIAVDNTGGACDGTLYVTFTDYPSGSNANGADVWISKSTDGGATWSAPLKVNDDGLPSRAQFHPFLQVDPSNGHVVVAWQDARNQVTNDAIDFFAARSTNCGAGFEANVQASQPSAEFNNSGISFSNHNSFANPGYNPNQTGEYMGLDVLGGKAYLAWCDTRHYFPGSTTEPQKDNLGFAIVDFTGGTPSVCGNNVKEGGEACDGGDLGGQTCQSRGFTGGTLACNANCTFDTSGCFVTTTTTTFTSVAAEDGYVLESGELTGVGGTANATDSTTSGIRAGDDRKNKQYVSILSFDTSPIPDGAVLQSVTLRLRRGTVVGTSPFTTHGSLTAAVRNGGFNGNVALETADFQAAATVSGVCTLSNAANNGDWSECTFNPAGLAALNKTGKTQIRIAFTTDDDNDSRDDYIGYYSANNSTPANYPQLVVVYQ